MLSFSRSFHHSGGGLQQEPRFWVNGALMTRSDILATDARTMSVDMWRILVDWQLQVSKPYVVIDPLDPTGLLYLNRTEYLSQCKVCVSNDIELIIVARPGTPRPVPVESEPSQTTPPHHTVDAKEGRFESKWSRASKASWGSFLDLRKQVRRMVQFANGSRTMVTVTDKTINGTVQMWARMLLHYAEMDNPGKFPKYLISLVAHLQTLLRNNGQMAAVQHLKVSLFALYSYISGNPLSTTLPLGYGVRLRKGLPAVWDKELRDFVRSGNMPIIRVMASLMNLYRALDAPHPELDLGSITQPHPNLDGTELFEKYKHFCSEIFPGLVLGHTRDKEVINFEYDSAYGMLIRTAGANISGPSISSIILDAKAWRDAPSNHVLTWFERFGDYPMEMTLEALARETHYREFDDMGHTYGSILRATKSPVPNDTHILGRLHVIEEPAGKNRVVAICDYFTQVALKPVHDHLFKILRLLRENDATFDQDGTVSGYFNKGLKPHWSFDLKSATDLIPLALYKEVLPPFLSTKGKGMDYARETVDLWAKLIADRDFLVKTKQGPQFVRYGTGQPMGALSSWASMALVHHSLVQFANYLVSQKPEWFPTYLILGDDVDIASSELVANKYQEICAAFGIIIGVAKSLKSNENFFEFANQRYCPAGNISPLSIREELASSTWTARAEYAKRILSRFGTAVRNETSAFLRKAVTAAQWSVLVPEMSGARSSTMLRLVRYCLLNPFHKEWKEIRISSVFEWLTEILPDPSVVKQLSVDIERTERLELDLVIGIASRINQDLLDYLRKIPKMVQPDLSGGAAFLRSVSLEGDTFFENGVFGRNRGAAGFWSGRLNQFKPSIQPVTAKCLKRDNPNLGNVPHSPTAWAYFNYCVFIHNRDLIARVDKLLYHLEQKVKRLPPFVNGEPVCAVDDIMETSLPYWMDLWFQVRQLPQPLLVNTMDSVSKLLEYNTFRGATLLNAQGQEVRRPETIYGPMVELGEILARLLGVVLPGLPFFNDGRRGRSWYRSLRDSLSFHRSWSHAMRGLEIGWLFTDLLESSPHPAIFRENQEEPQSPHTLGPHPSTMPRFKESDVNPAFYAEVFNLDESGVRRSSNDPKTPERMTRLRESVEAVVALAARENSSERAPQETGSVRVGRRPLTDPIDVPFNQRTVLPVIGTVPSPGSKPK